jgi:5-methylcytosine-specific restriction endonuclease McrA
MKLYWKQLGFDQRKEAIMALRDLDMNQHEIADYLSCHVSTIRVFAASCNIIGWKQGAQYGNKNAHVTGLSKRTIRRHNQALMKSLNRNLHICERCGFVRQDMNHHIHHKDQDRTNNIPENLEILCSYCHTSEHASKRERDNLGRMI